MIFIVTKADFFTYFFIHNVQHSILRSVFQSHVLVWLENPSLFRIKCSESYTWDIKHFVPWTKSDFLKLTTFRILPDVRNWEQKQILI